MGENVGVGLEERPRQEGERSYSWRYIDREYDMSGERKPESAAVLPIQKLILQGTEP